MNKKKTGIWILLLTLFAACVIIGCSGPTASDDDTPPKKDFYYDGNRSAFVGSFTWSPTSVGYKALIGADLVKGVYWRLEFPEWAGTNDPNATIANSITSGISFGDTHYSTSEFVVDKDNFVVTGTVKIASDNDTWKDVLKWADVPGARVRAIVFFKDEADSEAVKAVTGNVDLSPVVFDQETYYSMDLTCPNFPNVSEFVKQDEGGYYLIPYAGKYVKSGMAASTEKIWYKKIKSVTIKKYRKSDIMGLDENLVATYTASSDYWMTGDETKVYFSPALIYDENYDYSYFVTTWNIVGGWGSGWSNQ